MGGGSDFAFAAASGAASAAVIDVVAGATVDSAIAGAAFKPAVAAKQAARADSETSIVRT